MHIISEETRGKLVDVLNNLPYLQVAALIKALTTEQALEAVQQTKESKTRSK